MLLALLSLLLQAPRAPVPASEVVSFQSGHLTLRGVLYRPEGPGPFPALLYNHGSAPGMLNNQAYEQLGPLFARRGWVFFAPYRRGQGLSVVAGPFIGDEIAAAGRRRTWLGAVLAMPLVSLLVFLVFRGRSIPLRAVWALGVSLAALFVVHASATRASAATMVRLLETDHLDDQLAAFHWLEGADLVDKRRLATAGNSFGGVEVVLGAERVGYCAAIDASGGAESWATAPMLRTLMTRAVRNAKAPIFFFQAENDYDLSPSRSLSAEMKDAGKVFDVKIYPAFGTSAADGHSFAWAGSATWSDDVFRFLERHCRR